MSCSHIKVINSNGIPVFRGDSNFKVEGERYTCQDCMEEVVCASGPKKSAYFRSLEPSRMCRWHREWQSRFEDEKEVIFWYKDSYTRADAVVQNYVLEFQHSHIDTETVNKREETYSKNKVNLVWILDGSECDILDIGNGYDIQLSKPWMYKSFKGETKALYIHKGDYIYRVNTEWISKAGHVATVQRLEKEDFIRQLKTGYCMNWGDEQCKQVSCVIKQRCAGGGKTYFIVKTLLEETRKNKERKPIKNIVYLTKPSSAVTVLSTEFNIQRDEEYTENPERKIEKMEDLQTGSIKYKGGWFDIDSTADCDTVKELDKYECFTGTVDSFFFAITGQPNISEGSMFEVIAKYIRDGNCNQVTSTGTFSYAGFTIDLSETLVVMDEAQDMPLLYAEAMLKLAWLYRVNIVAVGDKLQSIYNQENIFTLKENNVHSLIDFKTEVDEPVSYRMENRSILDFVNKTVKFKEHGLQEFKTIGKKLHPIWDGYSVATEYMPCPITGQNNTITVHIQTMINCIESLLEIGKEEKYCVKPNDFLFLYPIMSSNKHVCMLLGALQEYWRDKFTDPEYRKMLEGEKGWKLALKSPGTYKFAIIHKSEDNKPIRLEESQYASRIVSIHSSKGDGRPFVFVLGITDNSLSCHRAEPDSLKYESMIHVAITRAKHWMYVGIVDSKDNFGRRFSSEDIDDTVFATELPKYRGFKITHISGATEKMRYLERNLPEHEIPITPDSDNVDWVHHQIRKCILNVIFILKILEVEREDKEAVKQFKAIIYKLSRAEIKVANDMKEYYELLYREDKDENQRPPYILLRKKYIDYTHLLANYIRDVQVKLKRIMKKEKVSFSNIEYVVLYFAFRHISSDNGRYMSKYEDSITLENMYNILKDYHEKEHLYKKHYDELEIYTENINRIFAELESRFEGEKFRFNYMLNFNICDSGIKIAGCHTIAWSEKTVIVFRLHPKISRINWVDMCKEQLLTSYVLPMDDGVHEASGEERILNKKVVTCFISHDHVYKEWNLDEKDKEDLKTNIINYVRKEYMLYNRRLFRYLEDGERRSKFLTEMKKACRAGSTTWTDKCEKDGIPDYIARIFELHKKKDSDMLYTEHFSEKALEEALESVLSEFLCE